MEWSIRHAAATWLAAWFTITSIALPAASNANIVETCKIVRASFCPLTAAAASAAVEAEPAATDACANRCARPGDAPAQTAAQTPAPCADDTPPCDDRDCEQKPCCAPQPFATPAFSLLALFANELLAHPIPTDDDPDSVTLEPESPPPVVA